MTIREALQQAVSTLEEAGVDSPLAEARLLLADLLHLPPLQLITAQDTLLTQQDLALFFVRVSRRAQREPLQIILGKAPFMGHEFETAREVLIPRFDTEALAERALSRVQPGHRVLDLCCGSGCLAVSVKLAQPEARVYAGDLSPAAIALTGKNAKRLGAAIDLRQGDLFAPFLGLRFDVILSNPPYIPTQELDSLQEEVRREPRLALDGGPDGLAVYRRILEEAPDFLRPGGYLLLELGDGQAGEVSRLVPPVFEAPQVQKDLAGLPRVLETRLKIGVH